jgi:hypothetical protein
VPSKDPFRIRISIRHPSYTPTHICKELHIKPELSHAAGDDFIGRKKWKWSAACAPLQEGKYASQLESSLKRAASFLRKHSDFLKDLTEGEGDVELILDLTISDGWEEGDKNFELSLAPAFLADLATRGIGLRVQGWQGKAAPKGTTRRAMATRRHVR